MAAFTESVEVTGIMISGDGQHIVVTLKQSSGAQFQIIDELTNVSEYTIGAMIQHTVGGAA